jgi:hypothetical protein
VKTINSRAKLYYRIPLTGWRRYHWRRLTPYWPIIALLLSGFVTLILLLDYVEG